MKRPNDFISINGSIKRQMDNQKLSPAEFARMARVSTASILRMINTDTCSVHRLAQYSKLLNYNFFAEISHELKIEKPQSPAESTFIASINDLNKQLSEKEAEITTLKRMIKLVTGKNTDEI